MLRLLTTTTAIAALVVFLPHPADAARFNTPGAGGKDMPNCYYTRGENGEFIPHGFCNAPYSPTHDTRNRETPEVVEVREPPKEPPCDYKYKTARKKIGDFFRSKKGLRTAKVGKQSFSAKSSNATRRAERAAKRAERQAARAEARASRSANRAARSGGKREGARGTVALEVLEPLL